MTNKSNYVATTTNISIVPPKASSNAIHMIFALIYKGIPNEFYEKWFDMLHSFFSIPSNQRIKMLMYLYQVKESKPFCISLCCTLNILFSPSLGVCVITHHSGGSCHLLCKVEMFPLLLYLLEINLYVPIAYYLLSQYLLHSLYTIISP